MRAESGIRVVIDTNVWTSAFAFCRDADDDKFIHAALAAKAPWLVTGDQDLLDVPPLPHLRIVTPADALQLLRFTSTPGA